MREWIEYHRFLGIDHFYMYNNNSNDDYLTVLQPYIEEGVVTLINWEMEQGQIGAYQDWYNKYRSETRWVTFIDIDEFICLRNDRSIGDWLKRRENYPCILMYWKMFGTSAKEFHDYERLVTEQYVVSWNRLGPLGKTFFNCRYDIAAWDETSHHFTLTKLKVFGIDFILPPMNEYGFFIRKGISRGLNKKNNTIQLNHYWSKAWNEYAKKMNRSDVFYKDNPKRRINYFFNFENNNIATDYTIYRFLIQLKHKMKDIDFQ